jgi:hypothetical protein
MYWPASSQDVYYPAFLQAAWRGKSPGSQGAEQLDMYARQANTITADLHMRSWRNVALCHDEEDCVVHRAMHGTGVRCAAERDRPALIRVKTTALLAMAQGMHAAHMQISNRQ